MLNTKKPSKVCTFIKRKPSIVDESNHYGTEQEYKKVSADGNNLYSEKEWML